MGLALGLRKRAAEARAEKIGADAVESETTTFLVHAGT